MDKTFAFLKPILKFSDVVTDNYVFRLHYRVTVWILLVFSVLISSSQYVGDPISCISNDDIPTKVLDTFCWIHSTFSLESAWHKEIGIEVPYPGVDKYTHKEKRVFHAYYQWVCFVLFLQAILFYVPRYFWKTMESGRIKTIVSELKNPVLDEDKKVEHLNLLGEYLFDTLHYNDYYFAFYYLAEFMNAFNVIGQMFLMDRFLGNSFSDYGIRVIEFTEWDSSLRYDPMVHIFPRMTKCTFHRFGSSGDVQKYDSMCILPINIINEKIYVFLWFWFIILACLSCIAVVYRALIHMSPYARLVLLKPRAQLVKPMHLRILLRQCSAGDWFLLYLLAKNIDGSHFRNLVFNLIHRIERCSYRDEVEETDEV